MVEKKLFSLIEEKPEKQSNEDFERKFLEAMEICQTIENDSIGRDEVTVRVKNNDPLMIICGSDLHAGSIATNHQVIIDLRNYLLSNDNVGLMLLGDEVEGIKQAYLNTNTARTAFDFQTQIRFIREAFLGPLAEKRKILGMVTDHPGHTGWSMEAATINTWITMAEGYDIPLIHNGGRARVQFANGSEESISIWHNAPGASKVDAVKGLREAAFNTSESNRTNGYMSGHIHRMGVGKELYSGAKTAVYYITSGTAKGAYQGTPKDRFGMNMGLPMTDPLGQGVILEPRRRSQKAREYPFASFGQGQEALKSLQLLNRVEQQGMTEELLDKIRSEVESKPKITLVSGRSHVTGEEYTEERPVEKIKAGGEFIENHYSKMRMRAPYDSLTYNIETQLPVALHLISNARLGSSSEGYDELSRYHRELIAGNPHSLVIFLRNMIDKGAGKLAERTEILDKFKGIINGAQEQTLAILMCESLRNGAWKRKVEIGEETYTDSKGTKRVKKIYDMPIAPGSYLANETNTPLIHHLSLIKLAVGPDASLKDKPLYIGAFADKLMNSGSLSQPTFGLKQLYIKSLQEKPGYVAGGHMPNAGDMMFYDRTNAETNTPILVAPGWFAKYIDTAGKGNVMPGAEPGQAIIFMPGRTKQDYRVFPTVNEDETGYMQDALTLMKGLEILGLTESVLGKK